MPDKISYLNSSGEAVPPFAVLQFESDVDFNSTTKAQTVKAYKPDGTGPYAIDDGKGADAANEGRYGQCLVPLQHTFWAHYTGASAPGTAWTTEVGPVSGQWYMDATGSGYWYAGSFDPDNQRILVQQKAASGGGFPLIHFILPSVVVCSNGESTATVDNVPCSCSSPAVGDTITVVDLYGEWSGETDDTLADRGGWAIKMQDSGDYADAGCAWIILKLDPAGNEC